MTQTAKRPALLLGTRNPGKARELKDLLGNAPVELVTLDQVGIDTEVEETGATIAENAALKARTYAALSGLPTLADDSGLEVDALGGEPGPLSSRYAGSQATDHERVRYLLAKLKDIEWERRGARFRSVMALAQPDGETQLFQGTCEGVVALEPRGTGGFGYDPIFYIPDLKMHMAELGLEEKNRISHRGRAARKVVEYLESASEN
ncbi:MAG: RdgB/HAM1 family non-canonical purine NTP pyrophosphatase [Chloroflexi bacterium]|nr:RdgB/HAM1 family non-canonical purine NTP pyrophosphatase [Chloroflexota bacterium]